MRWDNVKKFRFIERDVRYVIKFNILYTFLIVEKVTSQKDERELCCLTEGFLKILLYSSQ